MSDYNAEMVIKGIHALTLSELKLAVSAVFGQYTKLFGRPQKFLNRDECVMALDAHATGKLVPNADGHVPTTNIFLALNTKVHVGGAPPTKSSGLDEAIKSIIDDRLGNFSGAVDEERVTQIIKDYNADRPPRQMQLNDLPPVEMGENPHARLEEVLKYVHQGFHVRLVGPTGSGKTTLVRQVAKALGLSVFAISFTEETTKGDLLGRVYPTVTESGAATAEFVDGPLTAAAVTGGLFLGDEEDAGRANIKACAFPLIASGPGERGILPVPGRTSGQVITAHEGFRSIWCANTWGTGSDLMFVAREQQDEAWNDRFKVSTFYLDYDKSLEQKLCLEEVLDWGWDVRQRLSERKLRRSMSTRTLVRMSDIIRMGLDDLAAVKERYFQDWNESERSKFGA